MLGSTTDPVEMLESYHLDIMEKQITLCLEDTMDSTDTVDATNTEDTMNLVEILEVYLLEFLPEEAYLELLPEEAYLVFLLEEVRPEMNRMESLRLVVTIRLLTILEKEILAWIRGTST